VPGFELAVGERAEVDRVHSLLADTVLLERRARVGSIQTNRLVDRGATHGTVMPFIPLPELPNAAGVVPGNVDRAIRAHTTTTLDRGASYRRLVIGDHARVRLAGGTYEVAELRLGRHSRVEAITATELRVAGRVEAEEFSYLGPAPGANLSARDFRIEVSGPNGTRQQPSSVTLGEHYRIRALLLAANGRLSLGEDGQADGAFFARDVDVGEHSTVSFQDGFPSGCSCDDGNACNGVEVCTATGVCQAGSPVVCGALNQCHEAGVCDPATGACSNPTKPDGAACDDATACTGPDVCRSGVCTGANPVVCVAQDECHERGTCAFQTGECSNPPKPGTICAPLPPDPSTVAPALDPSVATDLFDSTRFL
jgi:hypothetical protein